MALRIEWSRRALQDLDGILTYIAKSNPAAASGLYGYLRERIDNLAEQPQMGRPGRIFGTRELVIPNYPYLVPYRVKGQAVQILRVYHTSQQLPPTW